MVVLDTQALLWRTLDPERLSPKACRICDEAEEKRGGVSSISIWEIGIKINRGNLDIGTSLGDYAGRLENLH